MFYFVILLFLPVHFLFSFYDLEETIQDFVIETKKIVISQNPYAFNASIIRWHGELLMSFRDIADPLKACSIMSASESSIYIVRLDENFSPIGEPYEIPLQIGPLPSRSEDARLLNVDNRLYLIYSKNEDEVVTEGGFRMYVSELEFDGHNFQVVHNEELADFEGQLPNKREKNWIPFNYQDNLFLAYELVPHRILAPILDGSGVCETFATTVSSIVWDWGELRGGTPALLIDKNYYISFFHSCLEMASLHSKGETVLHYFIGAYLFTSEPPFEISKISPEPIIGTNFYHGEDYEPYWKPVRVVFPCGLLVENDSIWISYGRQDHEIWIAKLAKQELLESLIPVSCARQR